jgi:hypothetical protein
MKAVIVKRPGIYIVVEYHDGAVAEPEAESFLEGLNAMIDGGSMFRAGETFRMGWSTMRFVDFGGGRLAFEELDGSGTPGAFTRGVSRTLIATRLQRSVIESFGLPDDAMDFPSVQQSAIVCTELDPDGALFMHRLEPLNRTDSGWFFSCQNEAHDHNDPKTLVNDSLYAHACRNQAVLPFLALPVGSRVLLSSDGRVEEAFGPDERELVVQPGSYLAQRAGRTSRS